MTDIPEAEAEKILKSIRDTIFTAEMREQIYAAVVRGDTIRTYMEDGELKIELVAPPLHPLPRPVRPLGD